LLTIKKTLTIHEYQLALKEILHLNYPNNLNEIENIIHSIKTKAMIQYELTSMINILLNYD